jgi:hypothetical protein
MQAALIAIELTFEEACQVQQALEARNETSTAALSALVDLAVLPAELLRATQRQIGDTNAALAKLQRALHPNSRRLYGRAS